MRDIGTGNFFYLEWKTVLKGSKKLNSNWIVNDVKKTQEAMLKMALGHIVTGIIQWVSTLAAILQ